MQLFASTWATFEAFRAISSYFELPIGGSMAETKAPDWYGVSNEGAGLSTLRPRLPRASKARN